MFPDGKRKRKRSEIISSPGLLPVLVTVLIVAGLLIGLFAFLAISDPAETRTDADAPASPAFDTIEQLTAKLETDTDNPALYFQRGKMHYDREEYADAITDFSTAIDLKPDYTRAYRYRCFAHNEQEAYERAIRDCETVLEYEPNNASAYNSLGLAYRGLEDYDTALEMLNEALSLDEDYAYALNNRGLVHRDMHDYEQAIADFTQSLEAGNDDPAVPRANRGYTYDLMEDPDNAMRDYNAALDIAPDADWIYLSRGLLHDAQGENVAAAQDYYRYVDLMHTTSVYGELRVNRSWTIRMVEGRLHRYVYQGSAREIVTIRAEGYENGVDPIIVLLNPDGEPVAGNDDRVREEDYDSLIDGYLLTESGQYTLLVSHAGLGHTGSVEVTFNADQ